MYECPLCGRTSNRRGDPFETQQQVIAHVDGSRDPNHEGVRGEDITEDIDEVTGETPASGPPGGQEARGPEEDNTGTEDGVTAASDDGDEYYGPEEVTEMIEDATRHARREGYQQGYTERKSEDTEEQQSSQTASSTTSSGSGGSSTSSSSSSSAATARPSASSTTASPKPSSGGSTIKTIVVVAAAGLLGLVFAAKQKRDTNQNDDGYGVDVAGLGEADDGWDEV